MRKGQCHSVMFGMLHLTSHFHVCTSYSSYSEPCKNYPKTQNVPTLSQDGYVALHFRLLNCSFAISGHIYPRTT